MVQLRAGNFGGGRYLALASEQEAEPAVNLPAGSVAGSNAQPQDSNGDTSSPDGVASEPEASAQSASIKAAEGSSAGGTTVSIAVYRSSFPIAKWDLNDVDASITKAVWASSGESLPSQGVPGQALEWEMPARYEEPTRAGFDFAGWSTDSSAPAGGYLDTSRGPAIMMPNGAPEDKTYTLYALWTPKEYAVVFDLEKNPNAGEGPLSETSFDLNWDTNDSANRVVTMLSEGRYRVDGFTMDESEYDPVTRTVTLPKPARSGYRFLGWAEPDGQSVVVKGKDEALAINPVRLTQIDGAPVLTARWASAFGVTAPISITFGDYDKTGAPGNPWLGDKDQTAADDTTQTQQDKKDAGEQEGYAKGGQAYFQNTSWNESIRMVELVSSRNANANKVLTTYDSSKAEEADVLGGAGRDGIEREGERLLSIYPSSTVPSDADGRKENGVHFRLADTVVEPDLDAFAMGASGSDTDRIDVSYGLNLSTDPGTGAANHGLVLETNDYERMPVAQLTYVFAVGEAAVADPVAESFWTFDDDGRKMRLREVKRDAQAIAAGDAELTAKYTRWMNEDHRFFIRWYDKGVREADAQTEDDSTVYEVRIIGVNYDDANYGGTVKNALTFQFVDILNMNAPNAAKLYRFNDTNVSSGGWFYSELRRKMNPNNYHGTDHGDRSLDGSIYAMVPSEVKSCIVGTLKRANQCSVPPTDGFSNVGYMTDRLFIASYAELSTYLSETGQFVGTTDTYLKERPLSGPGGGPMGAPYPYYANFTITSSTAHAALKKGEQRYKLADGTYSQYQYWWQRSAHPSTNVFKSTSNVGEAQNPNLNCSSATARGIVPCFCF